MILLGLHGGITLRQHEPAAALVINGKVAALCEEERYLRIKSAYGYMPYYSIKACLQMANIRWEDVDLVVMPGETYVGFDDHIRQYLQHNFGSCPKIQLIHHQLAHLAVAFYSSGLDESLVLSLDASGDGDCSMLGYATRKDGIKVLEKIPADKSLGYFYTMMTYYLGFADGDEYKVMGLAPYGKPSIDFSAVIRPSIEGWEFDTSFLRQKPAPHSPFEHTYSEKLTKLLGQPSRLPSGEMTDYYRNVARSTQYMFEQCLLSLIKKLQRMAPASRHLCYAGGTALNCSANKALLYSNDFDVIHVPAMSSDRGLALGCAYYGAVQMGDSPWQLSSAYLGSSYSNDGIRKELESNGIHFQEVDNPTEIGAQLLAEGKLLGWYQGRSEAGARALGNRSILASCRNKNTRDKVNKKIKYREEFRPFAPAVMFDKSEQYFQTRGRDLPNMCFTVDVKSDKADLIPAVVHQDQTARAQTVKSSDNELFYDLLKNYYQRTDCGVILNTSFNLKGQPIVESPRDALMTFYGCGLDALIMGNFVVKKPVVTV
ncbi:MAG: hypothetical protein A3F10_06310 [Coxiella sp. RIFCSPHIGHO2_12_FULL_42_15]|nr:MAG: hypothetical protein A3F10_06310 [Coxiella sp. RIFCSPHIGHO2_12_FULL_42_15]